MLDMVLTRGLKKKFGLKKNPKHSACLFEINNIHRHFYLQTIEQFEFDGCDNCEEYLHMKNNRDIVYDCTSSNFDG